MKLFPYMYEKYSNIDPTAAQIDNLMESIIETLKRYEKVVPKSRYRKNTKTYWCPELTVLKREKVHAY